MAQCPALAANRAAADSRQQQRGAENAKQTNKQKAPAYTVGKGRELNQEGNVDEGLLVI